MLSQLDDGASLSSFLSSFPGVFLLGSLEIHAEIRQLIIEIHISITMLHDSNQQFMDHWRISL